jgi:hypothetical protein
MNAIRATWTNGQIVPAEPVDWPEGSALIMEPLASKREKIGLTEDEWRDDPESIAEWERGVRSIEPPEYTEEEQAEMARYREQYRRYNIEAVRRQMEAMDQQ